MFVSLDQTRAWWRNRLAFVSAPLLCFAFGCSDTTAGQASMTAAAGAAGTISTTSAAGAAGSSAGGSVSSNAGTGAQGAAGAVSAGASGLGGGGAGGSGGGGAPCLDDASDPPAAGTGGTASGIQPTGVTLTTNDSQLKSLFDAAEKNQRGLVTQFTPKMKVLIEGGGYGNVWLETQPMGGEMYAKRNMEVAYNNIDAFLQTQRADGRLSGMITRGDQLNPTFTHIQGLFFVGPAFNLYYLLGHDQVFLQRLYDALVKFDAYLWKTRDSNGDGCLETWCVWDTGEDHSTKYGNAPSPWSSDTPPTGYDKVPIQSMDFMGYSYEMRAYLAKISKILGNGQESDWSAKAQVVKDKINSYLWSPTDHACFDRDKNGKTLQVLVHNNLRVMWNGGFSQQMADDFVKYHLVNKKEFWTTMPLPSIAVSDPLFRNTAGNDWSGQPEALTFQRAIRALENYRHFGELTLLGKKYLSSFGSGAKLHVHAAVGSVHWGAEPQRD